MRMHYSVFRAVAALTGGDDAERHFDLAADRIQRALLDVAVPAIEGLEIGVHAEPARLVGGDYIDLLVASHRSLVFGLGDASGKSLAAALNAIMLRYLVRGLVRALGTAEIAALVGHTNTVVTEDLSHDEFITFILGEIDVTRGTLRFVNAGHEPPLVLRAAAPAAEILHQHGMVLGVQQNTRFDEQVTPLGSGDTVLLYTDGLTEATNNRGELFTLDRLSATLVEFRELPAPQLAEAIFDRIKRYSEGELRDDATVLAIKML